MALAGYSAASVYGYSSARVKAMEAKLLDRSTMQNILNAKDPSTILSILFQTEYKKSISEYGGLNIKTELIDFALSKNLAENVGKLVTITPTTQRKITRALVGKWDLYNVRLALEAKDRRVGYDAISSQVIDYGPYNAAFIKEVLREETIEGMLAKFLINSPYVDILQGALETYRKSKSMVETVARMDELYYDALESVLLSLKNLHYESGMILKMDIDMKNVMMLLRAKKAALKFADVASSLIDRGSMDKKTLESIFNGSADVEAMVGQIKNFDLKEALAVYKTSKRMLAFEIGMRNTIFVTSLALLKHSILSYGTIVGYIYLKEIEIFTLRILIKAKFYGLSKEEIARLMVWRAE